MKKIITTSIIFLSPIIIFISIYIILDPYKVIFHYENYTKGSYLGVNRDYVSHEKVKENKPLVNSFILGSSRALAFRTYEWEKFLNQDDKAILYNAYGESIFGIKAKLTYLDDHDFNIKNVLIAFDTDHTFKHQNTIKLHYDYSGYNYLQFQSEMFKGYGKKAWIPYLDYVLFKKIRSYMNGKFDPKKKEYYTSKGNDMILNFADSLIQNDSVHYYQDLVNKGEFKRSLEHIELNPKINADYKEDLITIHNILIKNQTQYKIIINPVFDQKEFNEDDLFLLDSIFGKKNVYNFSGKNKYTEDYRNYYEKSHFKPYIGADILKEIYSGK